MLHYPGNGYDVSDADEAYIDTELSGGMAPGATIYYYASSDLYTGIEAAIDAQYRKHLQPQLRRVRTGQ